MLHHLFSWSQILILLQSLILNNLDPKSEHWCGPSHQRAAHALEKDPKNTLAADMSKPTESYACQTQDGRLPTFGAASASFFTTDPKDNDSLVIGIGPIIPRWDVNREPNRKLLYFVQKETFPTGDTAQVAASSFQAAADEWNSLGLGVTITSTNDPALANFDLVYQTSDPGDGTLAMAFFPNEVNQDVVVYERSFSSQANRSILKNIFMHELGHVLGLRHEFAITGDADKGLAPEGDGAVQFLGKNLKSIMSYEFPPTMRPSDREGTKAFYKLATGVLVNGSPVTDYVPQIRRRRRQG